MFVLALCNDLTPRPSERWLKHDSIDWARLKGAPLRIIYEDEGQIRSFLVAALANDCQVDLLDAGQVDYSYFSYDDSKHRAFKRQHGIAELEPVRIHMSPFYARSLLQEYGR